MTNDLELSLRRMPDTQQTAAVQTTVGRYMQEIQGMVFMAKQYPRDQFAAWQRIKEACSRKSLAEVASYEYPRGSEKVSVPTLRRIVWARGIGYIDINQGGKHMMVRFTTKHIEDFLREREVQAG